MTSKMKTNAVRLLDEMGITYELREYEVDPDDPTAETVAAKIGLPLEQVFKTLVARGDRQGVCFAVIPGNARLDLKALAKRTGDRKVETVPLKEVQPLTGYVRGGVTVLGAKRLPPIHIHRGARGPRAAATREKKRATCRGGAGGCSGVRGRGARPEVEVRSWSRTGFWPRRGAGELLGCIQSPLPMIGWVTSVNRKPRASIGPRFVALAQLLADQWVALVPTDSAFSEPSPALQECHCPFVKCSVGNGQDR
jgi:Cys-tRNA(Pro)/Cys-tRNA(Cys) deacylase